MSLESRKLAVASSPHVSSPIGTRSLMLDVLIALVPALCIGIWFFGPRALTMTVVSVLACEIFEYGYRKLLKRTNTCGDLSAAITGVLLAVVPLAVLSLTGADKVTQVATLAWGEALGTWALYTANIFALCAMMTSYWAVGGSMLTNIVDMFKLKDEKETKTRLIAIACTVLPPFILAYAGLVSFVDAIGWAGTFGGVIMSIVPVLMVNNARKKGDIEPEWKCGWYAHPAVQGAIIVIFGLAAIYFICSMVGILPAGW